MTRRRALLTSLSATAAASPAAAQTDASQHGFSPTATGLENQKALQRALDSTGAITVSRPGEYKLAGTVYMGSNTSIHFAPGVFIRKVAEPDPFTHVILNKGALTKTWDRNITVTGLNVIVNGVDVRKWQVYGLHGQLAFFYVRDLLINRFRCFDLGRAQYGIHVCTFEDILIDDVQIKGDKDGVHLGRGRRFTIRNGVFETGDDAIALNAHDYSVGNPELGWIEDGLIENMHDLPNPQREIGYFCRILAGAWVDWREGMEVQQSDTVVSNGRLYRVQANPDGTKYKSLTRPTHTKGAVVLDDINWGVVQDDVTYTCGVRNVTFRDIFLRKPRVGFSVHFDNDRYSRSYYPGAEIPRQENISIENVRVLYDKPTDIVQIKTPLDILTLTRANLRNNRIAFFSNKALTDYRPTRINLLGCTFSHPGEMQLVSNQVPNKQITLKTTASEVLSDNFTATLSPGPGIITPTSDLPGLQK